MTDLAWSSLVCSRMSGRDWLLSGVKVIPGKMALNAGLAQIGGRRHVTGQTEEAGLGNRVTERLVAGICERQSYVSQ